MASRLREVMLSLYSVLMRSHLEKHIQLWGPQQNKDIDLLKTVQKRATRLIGGTDDNLYYE